MKLPWTKEEAEKWLPVHAGFCATANASGPGISIQQGAYCVEVGGVTVFSAPARRENGGPIQLTGNPSYHPGVVISYKEGNDPGEEINIIAKASA